MNNKEIRKTIGLISLAMALTMLIILFPSNLKSISKTFLENSLRFFNLYGASKLDSSENQNMEKYMDKAVDYYYGRALDEKEIDPYDDTIKFYPRQLSDKVIMGQSDWMFLFMSNIYSYKGTNTFKTEYEYEKFMKSLETLNDTCNKLGKKLLILVCPEKEEIYGEYMPYMYIEDEEELPIKLKKYLDENTDIKFVYPKDAILKEKEHYRLYRKYDSHWNKIAAYIGVTEIYKSLGMEFIPLTDLKAKKIPEMFKDLTFHGGVDPLKYNDSFEYELEYKSDVETRSVDEEITEYLADKVNIYESNSPNQKSLFLYGDSYRINMMEFFAKDFKNSTFVKKTTPFSSGTIKKRLMEADIIIVEEVARYADGILIEMVNELQSILSTLPANQ